MNTFQENTTQYTAEAEAHTATLNRLSTLRLLVFVAIFVVAVLLANSGQAVFLFVLAPLSVVVFGSVMKRFNAVKRLKLQSTYLKEINEAELKRQAGKLSDFDSGSEFLSRDHGYITDFDIFGSHSLFQLINRTTTESGNRLLAKWFSEPASQQVIKQRQGAVKELASDETWRQNFQASGMHHINKKSQYQKLLDWMKSPNQLLDQKTKYIVIAVLAAIASVASAVYYIIHSAESDWYIHVIPLVVVLLVNSRIASKIKPVSEDIINNTHQNVKILAGYQSLIESIETKDFQSPVLQELKSVLNKDNYSAAQEIKKIKKILSFFQQKGTRSDLFGGNKLYPIVNIFFLVDIYSIVLSEQWKSKNHNYLASWASSVSEFEVFNSLAGFAATNPDFNFPEIKESPYSMHFQQLGHPLLTAEKRVCNDFDLEGRGQIYMITGSNMAGKSTFLRTVGINLVLAFTGAPCCAEHASVSSMRIFSSMRTQDNLEEGISSFYAELRRVEKLLTLVERDEPIFFLLDEMFKGTNSKDRHKGGFSLIKQLAELNAFGLISTHDLDMATLAGEHQLVTNFSFNSEIDNGNIHFNYTLTPRICTDFNASELMRQSGIKVLEDIEGIIGLYAFPCQ